MRSSRETLRTPERDEGRKNEHGRNENDTCIPNPCRLR
jgi:hypothetical protein